MNKNFTLRFSPANLCTCNNSHPLAAGGTEPMARGAGSAVPRADEAMPESSPGEAAVGSAAPRSRGARDTAPGDEPEAQRRREASNIVIQ